MSNSIVLTVEVEGFEDPFFFTVDIQGFDDPILGFKKIGFFDKSLSGKIKVRGYEDRPVRFRSEA